MNLMVKYLFHLNSQLFFLLGMIFFLVMINGFLDWYYILLFLYIIIFIFPLFYLKYLLYSTNCGKEIILESQPKTVDLKPNKFYFSSSFFLLGIAGIYIRYFSNIEDFKQFTLMLVPYSNLIFVGLLLIPLILFIFENKSKKDFLVLENFIFLNILKFKLYEIDESRKYLFTRKNYKKNDFLSGHKHLFGGIYYI